MTDRDEITEFLTSRRAAVPPQQAGLGLLGRRLDVHRQHVPAQPGEQPRAPCADCWKRERDARAARETAASDLEIVLRLIATAGPTELDAIEAAVRARRVAA